MRLTVEHIAQSSTSDFVSVLQQKIKEDHTPLSQWLPTSHRPIRERPVIGRSGMGV
ncbi:hypothetical protein GCM10025782_29760 [Pedococcus ginsenosidimutans]|uniref:Uncharacterized protein n=1 Tax=Pedococcus ginsenosidimutans TaxID=490570 RepID=A0ABP8YIW0_9MICO